MTWKSFTINLHAYEDTDLCCGSVYETRRYLWVPLGCVSACRHVSADTRADILRSLHDNMTRSSHTVMSHHAVTQQSVSPSALSCTAATGDAAEPCSTTQAGLSLETASPPPKAVSGSQSKRACRVALGLPKGVWGFTDAPCLLRSQHSLH